MYTTGRLPGAYTEKVGTEKTRPRIHKSVAGIPDAVSLKLVSNIQKYFLIQFTPPSTPPPPLNLLLSPLSPLLAPTPPSPLLSPPPPLRVHLYPPSSELAELCDVLTVEIEHVNCDILSSLEDRGVTVHPSPKTIRVVQDKYAQKEHFMEVSSSATQSDRGTIWHDG